MSRRVGRPMRYGQFIIRLDNEECYSVNSIIENARKNNLFAFIEDEDKDDFAVIRRRAFDALSKLKVKYLPRKEDGYTYNQFSTPEPAWYGWRWKEALPPMFKKAHGFPERPSESESALNACQDPIAQLAISPALIAPWHWLAS